MITPTKLTKPEEDEETLSMTSRDKARLFQMRGEIQSGSRLNSKFRDNDVRSKLFRRKNEETHSVNSANRGNLLPTVKPTSFTINTDRKTISEETSDNKFSGNTYSSETETRTISQENKDNSKSSTENITASPSTNDNIWRKESESKGNNVNVGLGSEYRDDDSISIRGQESDVTKSQTSTPENITNQIYSLPGTNSNDANSDHNQLQNRVNQFKTPSQNSSNIIYPNTDDVSSATIFLPTAPTFSITTTEPEPDPSTNSSGESTIIQAIFQQVDGLNQDTKVK